MYYIYYYRPDTKEFIFRESDKEKIFKYHNGKIEESSLYYPNSQHWFGGSPYHQVDATITNLEDVFKLKTVINIDRIELDNTLHDMISIAANKDYPFMLRWRAWRECKRILKQLLKKTKEFQMETNYE